MRLSWLLPPLLISIALALTGCEGWWPWQPRSGLHVSSWAMQLQEADVNEIPGSGYGLVVLDYAHDGTASSRYTRDEITRIRHAGIIPIAYLSIGEAEAYRFYWQDTWKRAPPAWLHRENPNWAGNYAVRYWDPPWQQLLYRYLDQIIAAGFQGVYLDKVDAFEYWSDKTLNPDAFLTEQAAAQRMIALIKALATYARDRAESPFYIIPQNGEKLLAYDDGSLMRLASGWAAEDLFYDEARRWQGEEARYIATERLPYLDRVVSRGKPVFSIDYVDDGSGDRGDNRRRIEDYLNRARGRGYLPFPARTDRALDRLPHARKQAR